MHQPFFGAGAVPLAVAVKDPGAVFVAVGVASFTGRAWLAGQVDAFIAGHGCGYVWVDAEAGMGKTAFAAWLVHRHGYVSHFARYTNGELSRVALQNLAGQLIERYGLGDLAPGGMLPEWVQTPDGFESVLGQAAVRARTDGQRLVIVVDGLDEAETAAHGLPWGLPRLLPESVFVVGTYRSGTFIERAEAPQTTLRIDRTSVDNQADVTAYLNKELQGETLAARLAQAGVAAEKFAEELALRCGGLWVYLRYVLAELRVGSRRVEETGDLPADLLGYYAEQIRRFAKQPDWTDTGLPLLTTLAAAGEPLPLETLADLTALTDRQSIRRWCDYHLRPFLDVSHHPRHYELYHASAREFLHGTLPAPTAPACPEHLHLLAGDLAAATAAAHSHIADHYLQLFGGLDHDLPHLATRPSLAQHHSGYPLRHLTRHLLSAHQEPNLHRLLTASADTAANLWYTAHDHAGTIDHYLDDLTLAHHTTATTVDHALQQHRPAPELGDEVRYALMIASIRSLTDSIWPNLLGQLITYGVWMPQRGLSHARRITAPFQRMESLLAVHRHLPELERVQALAEALGAVRALTDEDSWARALEAVVPHLPEALLADALSTARALTIEDYRARALAAVAPHLPEPKRAQVLAEALDAAHALTNGYPRVRVLAAVAPHLPEPKRAQVLAEALDAAHALTDEDSQVRALAAVAPHLPEPERAQVLAEALDAVHTLIDEDSQVRALADLVPHLPEALLAEALDTVRALTDEDSWARALEAVVPHLPEALLAEALGAVRALTDEDSWARALEAVVPHLPEAL
ncbi:hypothetical protein, partial [Streptomyces aureus]|uniref:hypothetical protein n=1 Tax=Streptomyces aureus TaxID=193461 RepID=UPI003682B4AB